MATQTIGKIVRIPVRKGGKVVAYATVDEQDAYLGRWRWQLTPKGYAERRGNRDGRAVNVRMHREVLGLTVGDGRIADHVNHDHLDNRRANLRVVTPMENSQNRKPLASHRGIHKKPNGRWAARAYRLRKLYYFGTFDTPEEAAAAAQTGRRSLGFLGDAA